METSFERPYHLGATIEFLLADGERVEYSAETHAREIDRLDRILRSGFPNDYEFTWTVPKLDTVLDASEDFRRHNAAIEWVQVSR